MNKIALTLIVVLSINAGAFSQSLVPIPEIDTPLVTTKEFRELGYYKSTISLDIKDSYGYGHGSIELLPLYNSPIHRSALSLYLAYGGYLMAFIPPNFEGNITYDNSKSHKVRLTGNYMSLMNSDELYNLRIDYAYFPLKRDFFGNRKSFLRNVNAKIYYTKRIRFRLGSFVGIEKTTVKYTHSSIHSDGQNMIFGICVDWFGDVRFVQSNNLNRVVKRSHENILYISYSRCYLFNTNDTSYGGEYYKNGFAIGFQFKDYTRSYSMDAKKHLPRFLLIGIETGIFAGPIRNYMGNYGIVNGKVGFGF